MDAIRSTSENVANNESSATTDITDDEGLQRAYNEGSGIYRHNNTLYIAGTKSIGDVGDWWKLPFNWNVTNVNRYKTADRYMQRPEAAGINRLVGHSLGSPVSEEIGKKYGIINVIEYSSPTIDLIPRNPLHMPQRYAYRWDPVSIFDLAARKYDVPRLNPHSYGGLQERRDISPWFNLPYF